MLMSF